MELLSTKCEGPVHAFLRFQKVLPEAFGRAFSVFSDYARQSLGDIQEWLLEGLAHYFVKIRSFEPKGENQDQTKANRGEQEFGVHFELTSMSGIA